MDIAHGAKLRFFRRNKGILSLVAVAALVQSPVMAQVYSGNHIGYLNFSTPPGYSLVTESLLTDVLGTNTVNFPSDLYPGTDGPEGAATNFNGFTLFTIDANGFTANNYLNGWTMPDAGLSPGSAWFVKNPYPETFSTTVVGALADGTNQLPAGFSACGSIIPYLDTDLTSGLFFPPEDGDQVFTFNNTNNSYSVYTFTNDSWSPEEPVIGYSAGFWVNKTAGADWVQSSPDIPLHLLVNQPSITSTVGQVNFFTFYAGSGGFGQVADAAGNFLTTTGMAQLYAGTNSDEAAFVPIGVPASFSAVAPGYVNYGTVSVPFATGGQTVYVQLRAWEAADGASFETASEWGAPVGKSTIMALTAHATIEANQPGLPPQDVNIFPSFRLSAAGVVVPVSITSPRQSGTNLSFSFASQPNKYYTAWTSADLTAKSWVPWASYAGTGSPVEVSLPIVANFPAQFVRVTVVNSSN